MIHEDFFVVHEVGVVSAFDLLGGFVGDGPDALADTSELVWIGCVPCWS